MCWFLNSLKPPAQWYAWFNLCRINPALSVVIAVVEPLEGFWLAGGKYRYAHELQKVVLIRGWNTRPIRIADAAPQCELEDILHKIAPSGLRIVPTVFISSRVAAITVRLRRFIVALVGMVVLVLCPTGQVSLFLASTVLGNFLFLGWSGVSTVSFGWKWSWLGLTAMLMLVHLILLSFSIVVCNGELSIWLLVSAAGWNTAAHLLVGTSQKTLFVGTNQSGKTEFQSVVCEK